MKRMLALVLCLCLALGGCAQGGETAHVEGGGVLPEPSPVSAEEQTNEEGEAMGVTYQQLALALAALPALPEEPDEAALLEQLNALDAQALGQTGYDEAYQAAWETYRAQRTAYEDACRALRGEGVDAALSGPFYAYTLRTAAQLMAGETAQNVVWSPANLYLALCMLAETTAGESRAQLLKLLGLSCVEDVRTVANALWRNLYRDGATDKTLLANALWLNEQLPYHEQTVDTLAKDYYASVFRAPMGEPVTDDAIHAWLNENTNHLLENAANDIETKRETLMLLLSALYFKGTWSEQFKDFNTREDTFTAADGAEQTVEFMHRSEDGSYYRLNGYTAAALPFCDGKTMWFLLPDEGVALDDLWSLTWNLPMVATTTSEGCYETPAFETLAQEGYGKINWSVPKFDVDSDLDLIPALQALGVTEVFDVERADFSPLSELDAVVSAVEHAARVKVDEEGCEAAAFTAIMVECTSAMPEELPVIEMNLNRPFGFLITGVSGLPLFLGTVNTMK